MATAGKSGAGDNGSGWDKQSPMPKSKFRNWKRNLLIILAIVTAGYLAWTWQTMHEKALLGAAYAARTTCICRFVSERSLESCTADLKAAELKGITGMASLAEDTGKRTIIATVPLLASQHADFHKDRGCQLEPSKD